MCWFWKKLFFIPSTLNTSDSVQFFAGSTDLNIENGIWGRTRQRRHDKRRGAVRLKVPEQKHNAGNRFVLTIWQRTYFSWLQHFARNQSTLINYSEGQLLPKTIWLLFLILQACHFPAYRKWWRRRCR